MSFGVSDSDPPRPEMPAWRAAAHGKAHEILEEAKAKADGIIAHANEAALCIKAKATAENPEKTGETNDALKRVGDLLTSAQCIEAESTARADKITARARKEADEITRVEALRNVKVGAVPIQGVPIQR